MGWFIPSVIVENRKIRIPEHLQIQLTQPDDRRIYWNIHPDERFFVLSDYPLENPEQDLYETVDWTLITDGGRYIRPPDGVPDDILEKFRSAEERTRSKIEEISNETGLSEEDLFEYMWKRTSPPEFEEVQEEYSLSQEIPNVVLFYLSESLISEPPNVAFLFSEMQFDLSPYYHLTLEKQSRGDRIVREEDVEEEGQPILDAAKRLENEFVDVHRGT